MSFVLGKGFVDIDVDGRGVGRLSSKITGALGPATAGISRAAAAVTALGVAFASMSVREAARFSEGMAEINTLLRATDEELAGLASELSRLAVTFGTTLTDNVNAAYDAISAFPDTDAKKIVQFLETATRAGIAGRADTKTAGDAISTVIQAYSMDISDAERVSDALFTTVRRGKTHFNELGSVMGTVAPAANAAGVGMAEMLAMMAGLTRQGVRTSRAGTALRATFNQLLKPNDALKEQLDLVSEAMGVQDVRTKGAIATLQALSDSVGGNKDALAELLPNIRGITAAFAVTGENAAGFREDLRANREETGAMGRAYNEMENEASRSFRKLKSTIQVASKNFGDTLLPAVRRVTDAIQEMIDTGALARWAKNTGEIMKDVVGFYEIASDSLAALILQNEFLNPSTVATGRAAANVSGFKDEFFDRMIRDRMQAIQDRINARTDDDQSGDAQADAAEKQGEAADKQGEAANKMTEAQLQFLEREKALREIVETMAGFDLPPFLREQRESEESRIQAQIDAIRAAQEDAPQVRFQSLDQRFIEAQQNANKRDDQQLRALEDQLKTLREQREDIGDIKLLIEGQPEGLRLRR